ncbi:MAG: hypothetical protein E6G71_16485 [Alphaproteobacteria bacterium]|nr:MAG: hypothetical protein E6G71_16485 [Alphaproteobacteria bacterium]
MLLVAILVLNPLGLDVLNAAFFSNEQLSRSIWQPIALIVIAMLLALVLLEWFLRTLVLKRRARRTTTA